MSYFVLSFSPFLPITKHFFFRFLLHCYSFIRPFSLVCVHSLTIKYIWPVAPEQNGNTNQTNAETKTPKLHIHCVVRTHTKTCLDCAKDSIWGNWMRIKFIKVSFSFMNPMSSTFLKCAAHRSCYSCRHFPPSVRPAPRGKNATRSEIGREKERY